MYSKIYLPHRIGTRSDSPLLMFVASKPFDLTLCSKAFEILLANLAGISTKAEQTKVKNFEAGWNANGEIYLRRLSASFHQRVRKSGRDEGSVEKTATSQQRKAQKIVNHLESEKGLKRYCQYDRSPRDPVQGRILLRELLGSGLREY